MIGKRKTGSKINKRTIIITGILILAAIGTFNVLSMVITTVFSPKPTEILGANTQNVEKPKVKPKIQPTDIVKGKNVTYEGEKHSIPAKEVLSMLLNTYKGEGKRVFLTFDDGPSPNTEKVLSVLDKEDVKATFFVLGQMLESDKSKEIFKRVVKDGHAIGNHSYTHDLKKLYPKRNTDVDYFMEEYNKTNALMKQILGEEFDTRVLRMPGGYMSRKYYKDKSLTELNNRFNNEGIVSIDWNALNGDAEGKKYSNEKMLSNVKESTANQKNVIILMHDTYGKQKTAEMLPEVIKFYKDSGYEFKTIGN